MHFSLATNFFAILKHHSLPPGPISSYVPFHHRQCNQIYWTLGNFTKPVATISLPKSPTFLGNFCKGEKIFNVSSEIIFGQLLQTIWRFLSGHTAPGPIGTNDPFHRQPVKELICSERLWSK